MDFFTRLTLNNWRQFQHIDLALDSQVTVLTGPNGCGKTTILNVLARTLGWNTQMISSPLLSKRERKRLWSEYRNRFEAKAGDQPVGDIHFESGLRSEIRVPENLANPQYQLQYSAVPDLRGFFIPSHRPIVTYVPITEIPTNPKTRQEQYLEFQQLILQAYGSIKSQNPGQVLKKSLISLALFGEGNRNVVPNREFRVLFDRFQDVLRAVLPKSIGFERLEVRMPDVVLVTQSGDFLLDAMSGGVSAVFGIAWQLHMYGSRHESCTVLIDEPENHLHPSMQREFLTSLRGAFPNYRFIVATHSPFILSSDESASVYALLFSSDSSLGVTSRRLSDADLSASPNEILKDVLGVPTTAPVWVEEKIKRILERYEDHPNGKEKAERIFADLKEIGLTRSLGNISF